MKTLTFAVALAAGYVLGTRAGREKYDQIVRGARKFGNHPTVVQAQGKAKDLIGAGTDAVTATMPHASTDGMPTQPVVATSPR